MAPLTQMFRSESIKLLYHASAKRPLWGTVSLTGKLAFGRPLRSNREGASRALSGPFLSSAQPPLGPRNNRNSEMATKSKAPPTDETMLTRRPVQNPFGWVPNGAAPLTGTAVGATGIACGSGGAGETA